ncbi:MAG: type II toxin-antitoxin system YafQ family toxin [Patescibacteria group bacterium]
MFDLLRRKQFRKDYKRVSKNPEFDRASLEHALNLLLNGEPLERRYETHLFMGKYRGCLECHIQPDILLIYTIDQKERVVYLHRIGSHSDLF